MMMTCPRCHFSQPKDRYCAQCGLDIDNYRPPQKPFFQRVFGDTLLQLTVILIVAALSGLYLYKNNRNEIQDRVTFFKQGLQVSKTAPSPSPPPPSDSEISGITGAPPPPAALAKNVESPMAAESEASRLSTRAKTAAPNADDSNGKITIQYAEIPQRVLTEQVFFDSRQSGQFNSLGDHVSGVWPQGKRKISTLRGLKWLGKETHNIDLGNTLQFFAGLRGGDPENDLGLTTYLEVVGVDGNLLRAHIEVVKAWRDNSAEPSGNIQRRFYPAVMELPADAYFFISGVLPRDSSLEADPYLTNIEPFKILKTPQFKSGESQFLILVEFERASP